MREDPELNKLLVFLENQLGKPVEKFIIPSRIKHTWFFRKGRGNDSNSLFGVPYPPRASWPQKFYFAHEIGHFFWARKNNENWKISAGCHFGKEKQPSRFFSCYWNESGAWIEAKNLLASQNLLTDYERIYFNLMAILHLRIEDYPRCAGAFKAKECPLLPILENFLKELEDCFKEK